MNNKSKWDSLTLKEKSEIMKMAISSGVRDLNDIRKTYNLFYDGGNTEKQNRTSKSTTDTITEAVLNTASGILNSGLMSEKTKERLVEFAMRLSGGNSSMQEANNILSFMTTSDGIKALAKVVFTDEAVGSIVQKSLDSSQSPLVGNYSGFALPSDVLDPDETSFLEEHPKDSDFVNAYIEGKIPFRSAGVQRISEKDKTRYGRYEQYINENYKGRDVQTYQGHRDTLPEDLVNQLNLMSSKKQTSTFGVHDTEVPFPFGEYKNDKETRGYYDAAGYNLELVEGPDGKTYGRISDMYDFLPRDYVRQYNKEGHKGLSNIIGSVDKIGHPFIFRSPWFDANQFNVPEHIVEEYNNNKKKDGNKYLYGGDTNSHDSKVEIKRVRKSDIKSTKEKTEQLEDIIAKRHIEKINIANEKGNPSDSYFIPYKEEIKIPGVGRTAKSILDSIAVNAKRAGITMEEAYGLAAEETVLGATPTLVVGSIREKKNKHLTEEKMKEWETAIMNTSYARNYGGIHPQFLINNHEWTDRGWEESPKYKSKLKNIKSPLEHGFTLYKMGLYNTGDPNHTKKVKAKGKKVMATEAFKEYQKNSEFHNNSKAYGGQTEEPKGDILGIPVPQGVETSASFVPILGTLMDAKALIEDPSWENAGYLGLSILSEIPFLKGLKAAKMAKAAKVIDKYDDAVKAYNKAANKVRRMESTPNLNPKKINQAKNARGKAYHNMKVSNPATGVHANNVVMDAKNFSVLDKTIGAGLFITDEVFNTYQQFGK